MIYNNFISSTFTSGMKTLLATIAKIMTKDYTWSDFKQHNTLDFFVCVICKTIITSSNVDTKRTSDKVIILQSCILDLLPTYRN